jgi:hypothetical protein
VSTNQLRRQDEDNKRLREALEQAATREREHMARMREQLHRYADLESQVGWETTTGTKWPSLSVLYNVIFYVYLLTRLYTRVNNYIFEC